MMAVDTSHARADLENWRTAVIQTYAPFDYSRIAKLPDGADVIAAFSLAFVNGDPPFYGMVNRDRARLCLRRVCEPVFVADIRQREHLLSAGITVDTAAEIKQLFLEFQSAGVSFHQGLKREPWGARNFVVLDPDGNLILFAGPAD